MRMDLSGRRIGDKARLLDDSVLVTSISPLVQRLFPYQCLFLASFGKQPANGPSWHVRRYTTK